MKIIPKQLVACTGALALSAVGLYGAVNHARNQTARPDQFWSNVENVLAMTPAQQNQARAAFDQARQEAQPVRQQLKSTTNDLRSAIKADNSGEIQRLSTTEGQEIGQLVAIRISAIAKVYKNLTPDQQKRAQALRQLMMQNFRHEMGNASVTPSAS